MSREKIETDITYLFEHMEKLCVAIMEGMKQSAMVSAPKYKNSANNRGQNIRLCIDSRFILMYNNNTMYSVLAYFERNNDNT